MKSGTKVHYLNQSNYIPMGNESGVAKEQVFSIRRLRNTFHRGQFDLVIIKNDEEEFSLKGWNFPLQNPSNSGFGSQH